VIRKLRYAIIVHADVQSKGETLQWSVQSKAITLPINKQKGAYLHH
jgi:hypothetical protein